MTHRRYILPLLIAAITLWAAPRMHAQGSVSDSLRRVLKDRNLPDSSRVNTLAALAWEEKYEHSKEAAQYATEAVALGQRLNCHRAVGDAHKVLGIISDEQGRYAESISQYLHAITHYLLLHDPVGVARAECNIGMVYRKIMQPKEAIGYFRRCLPIFERTHFVNGVNLANQNLGICYFDREDYDSALVFFMRALKVVEENHLPDASIYGNIANCYSNKDNDPLAEKYMLACVNKYIANGDSIAELYFWQHNLGVLYTETGRAAQGIRLLKAATEGYERLGLQFSNEAISLYKSLAIALHNTGDNAGAYSVLTTAMHIHDSVFNAGFAAQMSEMKEKYEANTKELSIANLEKEKKLKDAEIGRQGTQKLLMAAGLLFAAALLAVLWKSLRRRKRDHQLIQLQKDSLEQKNREILDSIHYAQRIQKALMASEKYIGRTLNELQKEKN